MFDTLDFKFFLTFFRQIMKHWNLKTRNRSMYCFIYSLNWEKEKKMFLNRTIVRKNDKYCFFFFIFLFFNSIQFGKNSFLSYSLLFVFKKRSKNWYFIWLHFVCNITLESFHFIEIIETTTRYFSIQTYFFHVLIF